MGPVPDRCDLPIDGDIRRSRRSTASSPPKHSGQGDSSDPKETGGCQEVGESPEKYERSTSEDCSADRVDCGAEGFVIEKSPQVVGTDALKKCHLDLIPESVGVAAGG